MISDSAVGLLKVAPRPGLSYPITKDDLKVLDKRYDCYKKYLPATEAAELGQ